MPRPQVPAAPRYEARRLDGTLLALLLALALALRLALLATSSGLTMDSPLYVRMSERLLEGHREASPAHHGYPLLIAAASRLIPGRELPGRMVSLAASLALVASVWAVARRRWTPWRAAAPTLLVAAHPLLAAYGVAVMTESTFLALAFGGVALLDGGRARGGGALLGAAWWVRPEAVVIAPLAVLLARGTWRGRASALLVAACVALPHTVVLRVQQGHWSLSPKTALVHAPAATSRAAEWRLGDSSAFADRAGLATRLSRDGGAILRAYPAGLIAQSRRLLDAWPWLPLIGTAFGLISAAGRGPWLAFLAPPLVYPLLATGADLRFAQFVVPALAIPVGAMLAEARPRGARAALLVAIGLPLAIASLWSGPAGRLAFSFDDGPMAAMRGAGAWISAHTRADAMIMDRKSYVPFFAQRAHMQLPDEPLDTVLEYARASGATHLVVEEYVVRSLRPQLAPLLDTGTLPREPRVRLVFATHPAPGDGVAVLEVVR